MAISALAAGLCAAASEPAGAQDDGDRSASGPKVTSRIVQDWRVACHEPPIGDLKCRIVHQLVHDKLKKNALVVTVAYSPARDRDIVQFLLPLDFLLKPGVGIEVSSYKTTAAVARCALQGCFIEGEADPALVAAMKRTTRRGEVTLTARTGKTVAIPFSLAGFSAAYDRMRTENVAFADSGKAKKK